MNEYALWIAVIQNQKSSLMACVLESTYLPRCFSPKGPYGYSSGVGALTSSSRAVKLSPNSRSAPARLSSRYLSVLAPMIGAVTPGRFITQLRATWLGVLPIESAISRTTSSVDQFCTLDMNFPIIRSYIGPPEAARLSLRAFSPCLYLPC